MADYSSFETLQVEREDGLLMVTLNRPASLNAVNPTMHGELEELFYLLAKDRDANAVVMTGAGRAFCAGGDVKGMAQRSSSSSDASSALLSAVLTGINGRHLLMQMLEVQQPIIAAVNGDAIGLGATIALCCDVVIAAENARFGDTHVKVGLVAGDGGAVIWPLLVGVNRAKELLMTGDLIDAKAAERIGLVNRVVSREEVLPSAKALARRLADGPRWAIRWTKVSVNKHLRDSLSQMLDTSLALETLSMLSEDHREASTAFAEKRAPKFTGR